MHNRLGEFDWLINIKSQVDWPKEKSKTGASNTLNSDLKYQRTLGRN